MEDIKLLVLEEGRSARNLVAFNVPVMETQCDSSVSKVVRKPPTSPRSPLEHKKDEPVECCKNSRESSQSGSRVRSASTGRDKKSELHARYWAFLFGNLQRAVDEIYQTCESDESVTECKEVIMVLDNYSREFKNLINWFKIKWEYESTPPPQRPHSLAWEIRKSSPGKIRQKSLEPVMNDNIENPKFFINSSSFLYSKNKLSTEKCQLMDPNIKDGDQKSLNVIQSLQRNNVIEDALHLPSSNSLNGIRPKIEVAITAEPITLSSSQEGNKEIGVSSQDKNTILMTHCHEEVVMTDEVCQTEPEQDVDENGPKYRSSSQQTSLADYHCIDTNNEENLNCANSVDISKKQNAVNLSSTNNITVTKTLEKSDLPKQEMLPRDEAKILGKGVSNKVGTNKILLPTNSNSVTGKTIVRNSYSQAATIQTKPVNLNGVARPGSAAKLTHTNSNSNKISNSAVQRPLWAARSAHGKIMSTSDSSGMDRLTRSKTDVEVCKTRKDSSNFSKSIKAVSYLKQNGKEVKPIKRDGGKSDLEKKNVTASTSSSVIYQENSGSVEVLSNQENSNEEDDGWVKVRSKSRFSPAAKTGDLETKLSQSASNLKLKGDSKMNHKTRFHQPSSAMSLPTLAFSAGDCKENVAGKKMAKAKPDGKHQRSKESEKFVRKPEKNKSDETSGNKKKNNNFDRGRKNFNRSSNDKNETDKNSGRNSHAKMEKLENEKNLCMGKKITKVAIKSIALDQESIDEEENNFDEEIKKKKETEEMLQKEINELEAADIELETGDDETDGETTAGTEEELDQEKISVSSPMADEQEKKNCSPKKTNRYHDIFNGMSWADHMDTLDELEKLVVQDCSKTGMTRDEQLDTLERLEEFVARHPGRALELHQKLSSPSRRRTMLDTVKKFQARQAKASEKREQLKMEKAQRLRELLKKVDEVKAAKDKLIEDKRQRLEMKLKRAAENRNLHLKEIMRKAHDEEEKLKEIAFINELEAQNKRHDFMTQCQEQEGRLQGIHEERQRKQEEKAAKEAAVEERRKAIEAERQEKLEKMQERQRKRDEQADRKKQAKEKERQELAREKARDRSERLEALHAAQLEAQEELQKKIQQKQEDYARRHEENIEQIRQKALELSISKCSDDVPPRLVPYETQKLCTACNVLIGSEVYLLSHLRGKKHQEALKTQASGKDLNKDEVERLNIKIIVNAPSDKIDPKIELDKERIKNFKKKCKKIRTRMVSKGAEYLSKMDDSDKPDSPSKSKIQKCLRDIEKVINSQGKGQWSDSAITILERSMGEINRTLGKQDHNDQLVFKSLNGFSTLNTILKLDMDVPQNMTPYLPQKCFVTTSRTYLSAVMNSSANCKFVILSNKIISLLDILLKRLTAVIPDQVSVGAVPYNSKSSLPADPVASVVIRVIAKILMGCREENNATSNSNCCSDDFLQRLQDIISYTVSVGIVDKLTRYCKSVRDPMDNDSSAAQFLLNIVELLTSLAVGCKTVRQGNEDPTQLLATLQVTELVGAVSILYGMLLHQNAPPRLTDSAPPQLPEHTIDVALATIRLLRSVAELDLQMFQSILGAEGISLQFRHIASYLLWYCCHGMEKILLHEVVAVVGYFAVQHRDNQMILQSGSTPTVLQQLCNLPFPYFSNPELSAILFPTLLACCSGNEENRDILEQEISYSLLEDFMESEMALSHPLILLISPSRSPKGTTE